MSLHAFRSLSSVRLGTLLALALSAGFSLGPVRVQAHADHGQPQFGGVVAEAGVFQGEWVQKSAGAAGPQLVLTHHGVPVSTAQAKGRLVIVAGGRSTEATLVPTGTNRMQPAGTVDVPAGARLLVTITLSDGRQGALRFELR